MNLYWDVGAAIADKQTRHGWGEAVVGQVAADLRHEFPDMKGFSNANIWRMRQFYQVLSEPTFLAQAAREIAKKDGSIPQEYVAKIAPSISAEGSRNPKRSTRKLKTSILAQAVRELAAHIPWYAAELAVHDEGAEAV